MARLIVEEAGDQRMFRLGDGMVTIGSGEGARLKLTAPGVADVHAELEISNGAIRLRPRPGVTPPTVAGQPSEGEVEVRFGQIIQLGDAVLRVERDEAALVEEGAPPPRRAPEAPAPARASHRGAAVAAGKRHRPVAKPKSVQTGRSVVDRVPRERQEGVPTWFVIGGVLVGLLLVVLLVGRLFSDAGEANFDPGRQIEQAEQALKAGDYPRIDLHLDRIPDDASLTDLQKTRLANLRDWQQAEQAESDLAERNRKGTEYYDKYLVRYSDRYLQGSVDAKYVPLFLKRCRAFRDRWPQHPQLAWVTREETRWSQLVSLSDPLDWDAVWWEAYYLTARGSQHDYRTAFRLLDEYEPRAKPEEKAELVEKRVRLVKEREEFFWEEMGLAEHQYTEKHSVTTAVQKLVGLVQRIGHPEFEDQAARDLVAVLADPRAEGFLAGYQRDKPEVYAELIRNSIVKDYAREQGLE